MIKKIDLTKRYWQWFFLLFLSFLWGSSFILMKRGLESFTNNQVAAIRIFTAFVFFIPFIIRRLRKIKRQNVKSLLVIGFIGNFFPAFLFTKAQTQISSALAGMLNALVPFFALVIGVVIFNDKKSWLNIGGVFVGLIGAIGLIVLGDGVSDIFSGQTGYAFYIVLATLFYAISVNEIKHNVSELDGVTVAALAFMFIGPFAGIYLLFSDFSVAQASQQLVPSLFYVVLLGTFSSFFAVILFNILIKYTTALFGASVTYIIPIFAIFWGIGDGETVSALQLVAMAFIMAGVYLVNTKR